MPYKIIIILFLFMSCSSKQTGNKNFLSKKEDTKYLTTDSSSNNTVDTILNKNGDNFNPSFYLAIEHVFEGELIMINDPSLNANVYFRIITTTFEESRTIYIEKISFDEGLGIKLLSRVDLNKLTSFKYDFGYFKGVTWISPTEVVIEADSVRYKLELNEMKITIE